MNHEIRNTPVFTPDFSLLAFLSGGIQDLRIITYEFISKKCKTNPMSSRRKL